MNNFDFSLYDFSDESPKSPPPVKKNGESKTVTPAFDFSMYDYESASPEEPKKIHEDSFLKGLARTALQIPQGIAQGTSYGLTTGLFNLLALGETELDLEEELILRKALAEQGKTFDEDEYQDARGKALSSIPTVSNIASSVEERTGLPLEPRTKLQKGLNLASTISKGLPGKSVNPSGYALRGTQTPLPRRVIGASVAGTSQLAQLAGVPEEIADLASLGIIKNAPVGGPRVKIAPVKKPSGLTTRRYETLEKPREVSRSKLNQINQSVETEFRDITDKILKDSPVSGTREFLLTDPLFKKNVVEGFQEVRNLADKIPGKFQTKLIKNDLKTLSNKSLKKGLSPGEFEKEYSNFLKDFIKDIKSKNFDAPALVDQFRSNNRQLSEAFAPGQSFAYNRAKREALLDYNKVIADMVDTKFPNSNFSKLFKETNKKWSDIIDIEAVHNFMDDLFDGKINYKKGRQLFDKNGATIPFKKAMGKEGFAKFETLLNDLMTTEKAHTLLKEAKSRGFTDLATSGLSYLVHPKLGAAKLLYGEFKHGYKSLSNALLDKPQIAITWDRGINAAKAGNFKVAEKEFNSVKNQVNQSEISRIEALKKFNEKRKAAS